MSKVKLKRHASDWLFRIVILVVLVSAMIFFVRVEVSKQKAASHTDTITIPADLFDTVGTARVYIDSILDACGCDSMVLKTIDTIEFNGDIINTVNGDVLTGNATKTEYNNR